MFIPLLALLTTDAHAVDVVVVATMANYGGDVVNELSSSAQFGVVDLWDGTASVPTLGDLANYQVVMLQYDSGYLDSNALGDVLADYVDLGGNVVAPSFDWAFPGLGGRFAVGGYHAFSPGNPYFQDDRPASGTPFAGVYMSGYFNEAFPTLAPTANLVASYDDGAPLVAEHVPSGAGRVVAVNDYNVSNMVGRSDFWDNNYDGREFWANVVLFAAFSSPQPFFRITASGACNQPTTITVDTATPNSRIIYVTGRPVNSAMIPSGPCAGTRIPVTRPTRHNRSFTDATGSSRFVIPSLPGAYCGDRIVAIDMTTCRVAATMLP